MVELAAITLFLALVVATAGLPRARRPNLELPPLARAWQGAEPAQSLRAGTIGEGNQRATPRQSASVRVADLGAMQMAGLQMKYFIVKPQGDDAYAKASRAAMRSYANHIRDENEALSDDLRAWADRETPALNPEAARADSSGE